MDHNDLAFIHVVVHVFVAILIHSRRTGRSRPPR